MIDVVLAACRCSQGINPDDEADAVHSIRHGEHIGQHLIARTALTSFKSLAISDQLHGQQKEQWLIMAPNAWRYQGPYYRDLSSLAKNTNPEACYH